MSFFNKLKTKQRETWYIDPASWHGRLYSFWKQHAALKAGSHYRENLCHYVRVILFWAPLAWINFGRPFSRVPGLRRANPWMFLVGATVTAGLAVSFMLAPIGTWQTLAYIGGIILWITLVTCVLAYLDNSHTAQRRIERFVEHVLDGIVWAWDHTFAPVGRLLQPPLERWFSKTNRIIGTMVGVPVISLSVLAIFQPWIALWIAVGLIGATGLITGLWYLLEYLEERSTARRLARIRKYSTYTAPAPREPKGDSFFSLLRGVREAEQKLVCPLIEIGRKPAVDMAKAG